MAAFPDVLRSNLSIIWQVGYRIRILVSSIFLELISYNVEMTEVTGENDELPCLYGETVEADKLEIVPGSCTFIVM